jgi:hypothetical protein
LPRHRTVLRIALVCAAALAVAGCKGSTAVFQDQNDGGWFSKPVDVFAKPDWARPTGDARGTDLGPQGPVGPDDLVGADGRCVLGAAETAQAAAPPPAPAAANGPTADRPVGSTAGDLAGTNPGDGLQGGPQGSGPQGSGPQVLGGIALGMTECQAVHRAGQAGNVNISAGDRGERTVVLTYLSGPWPGIYHFADGRLKVIDRAPAPPEPPKAPPKKKTKKKPAKKPAA